MDKGSRSNWFIQIIAYTYELPKYLESANMLPKVETSKRGDERNNCLQTMAHLWAFFPPIFTIVHSFQKKTQIILIFIFLNAAQYVHSTRNDLIFLHSTPKNQTLMEVHTMCVSAALKRSDTPGGGCSRGCGLLISVMGVSLCPYQI